MTFSTLSRLADYRNAPRGPGLYIIGVAIDPSQPVELANESDDYLWNYPTNLTLEYVGNSLSKGYGVRGRLSSHARKKGCKGVAEMVDQGKALWFAAASGPDYPEFEAGFLALRGENQFALNTREEYERSAMRQQRAIRAAMTENERDFRDRLDMGEHGEGM